MQSIYTVCERKIRLGKNEQTETKCMCVFTSLSWSGNFLCSFLTMASCFSQLGSFPSPSSSLETFCFKIKDKLIQNSGGTTPSDLKKKTYWNLTLKGQPKLKHDQYIDPKADFAVCLLCFNSVFAHQYLEVFICFLSAWKIANISQIALVQTIK